MCSILGAIFDDNLSTDDRDLLVSELMANSLERGRDGVGLSSLNHNGEFKFHRAVAGKQEGSTHYAGVTSVIGNTRAEPTTEYVAKKELTDQQPYALGGWSIVHNGTIANDKELRTYELETSIDSAAIVETLDGYYDPTHPFPSFAAFIDAIKVLKGSYAILAQHSSDPSRIFYACNYRPIWLFRSKSSVFLGSSRSMLGSDGAHVDREMLQPYSLGYVTVDNVVRIPIEKEAENKKTLVVASGGLDSTVAAAMCKASGLDVTLAHFTYGSRAQAPELKAVKEIAKAMDVPYRVIDMPVYSPEDSPLLQADSEIAGGEEGAEFAHEWVPARNLVMLAFATAYAEANGFQRLVLGNNMEEAGAYPDNEPEFIDRFNDLLDFAVGSSANLRVIMPVGNLMKSEIVAQGLKVNAPMDKTWSCYRSGEKHCGTCGPCFMRRTAFEINNEPEVIEYDV